MTVGLPQAPDKTWNDGKDFSTALEMTVEGMTGKYTKKSPGRRETLGASKNRGYLLSQLVGQYHRRW